MKKIIAHFQSKIQIWPAAIYFVLYMYGFRLLEQVNRSLRLVTVIHTPIDDRIPFVPAFSLFYLSWFPFMILVYLYFAFINKNVEEYNRLIFALGAGMTVFLIISALWPNGLQIRSGYILEPGFFTDLIRLIWRTDTPTNVFPSIHVYNSVIAGLAVRKCRRLSSNKWLQIIALVWVILICASTLLIRQHSLIDASAGLLMALGVYYLVYIRDVIVRGTECSVHERSHASDC
ncbi:MAG: phosphatase PAP2 family protein [Eubacteriales bacterium]|nr:phosphatase PAP2 family protein [Eubacteriales bacterium]